MELHRQLTIVGMVMLIATFLINYYVPSVSGFNYAYVSGMAMLAAFSISFVLFARDRMV